MPDKCPLCWEVEGRRHRLLECTHFASNGLFEDIGEHDEYLCELPAPRVIQEAYFLRVLHFAMPGPSLDQRVCSRIQQAYGSTR